MLTDTHCHLDFPEFETDRKEVIARARESGLGFIVNIGSSVEGSRRSLNLAEKHDFIYASAGIHPHHAGEIGSEDVTALKDLLKREKLVAVGEVGLDYFRNLSSRQSQRELFVRFIHLARDYNLPLVVHDRDAHQEVLEILKAEAVRPLRGVVHCFSAGKDFARKFLDLGLYISFTANITYKKSADLREAVRYVPLERLLLETDSPFLAPQIHRGKRNEPAYVRFLAEELAKIKGEDVGKLGQVTEDSARGLFAISQDV